MNGDRAGTFDAGSAVTVAVLLLFARFVSVFVIATVAVFETDPPATGSVTFNAIVAEAPAASVPSVQVTVVVPVQVPCEGVAEPNVAPGGSTSVTTALDPMPGPALVTVIE